MRPAQPRFIRWDLNPVNLVMEEGGRMDAGP
jgi:hypothetical protein